MRGIYRKINIFIIIIFFTLCFSPKVYFASDFKIWYAENKVETNKIWKVKFNMPINEESLSDNIWVLEKDTNKYVEILLSYNKENYGVSVSPANRYSEGKTYELIVQGNVMSESGNKLSVPIKYVFTTKANENNEYVPGNKIDSYEEFYNAVKYGLSNFEDKMFLTINNYNPETYSLDIINKVIDENPLLDYGYIGSTANTTYYDYSEVNMTIDFNYSFTKERMIEMKYASEVKAKEIINKVIKPNMIDYEKELALHDYLVSNSQYDRRLFTGTMSDESYTDYGVLVEGRGVCSSYAKAMFRLLNEVGIETLYVTGKADNGSGYIGHAWNIVKIQDEYYHLDATWNDPVSADGKESLRHSYFNVTDEQIGKNHVWDKDNYPICNINKHSFDNLGVTEIDDDGDEVVVIKSYEEYYNIIKEALKNGKNNVSLKVLKYDGNTYNISNTISDIISKNYNIRYNGARWTYYEDELSGAEYIKIYFN